MVLEGATAPEDTSFSDQPPSSDVDPYSQQNPDFTPTRESSYVPAATGVGVPPIYVNLNTLPHPFLSNNQQNSKVLAQGVQDSCRFAANVLKRPVKQEEADALAFHFAKSVRIASFGAPLGSALAAVFCYRGRRTYRFPGWSPFKEGSRLNLSANSFGPLKGQLARVTWHTLRFSAYGIVGSTLGSVFYGSYALTVAMTGRAMDPKLKEFNEALNQRIKDARGNPMREQDTNSTTQKETWEQRRQRRQVQDMGRSAVARKGEQDDMSPTGGAFGAEYTGSSTDTGLMSDEELSRQGFNDRTDSRMSSEASNETDRSKSSTQQAWSRPGSPQSKTSGTAAESQGASSQTSGSTWERLRQGAMSSNAQTGTGSQQSSGTSTTMSRGNQRSAGDGFSFSETDEERQLAKSEAQKNFDSRMERERAGKDFDDRGNGRGSW